MRVWMYEMIYNEIEGVLVVFTFDDWSGGVRRASVGNVRPGSMLVVRDGVDMAYMGCPFAPYLSLSVILSHSIDLRKPDGLPWRRSYFGVFQVPPGEDAQPAVVAGAR